MWHLSYVVDGAALAPVLRTGPMLASLAAFFLAVGVGAHALDELNGRPLRTRIPDGVLWALGIAGIGGALAIGVVGCVLVSWWLVPFVVFGGVVVVAYNLELLGGRLHGDWWFAVSWGGFPLLTAYFACAERVTVGAVLAAGFATLLSLAQRALSTPVRAARRRVAAVDGRIDYVDGTHEAIGPETLTHVPELALRILVATTVCLAAALLAFRL